MFFNAAAGDADLNSTPVAMVMDSIVTLLDAQRRMPLEILTACDHLENSHGQDRDHGLAEVWMAIPQGATIVSLCRALAEKRTKELGFLEEVSLARGNIKDFVSKHGAEKDMETAVDVVQKSCAALAKAAPKATSEAAKGVMSDLRSLVGPLLLDIINTHARTDISDWINNAIAGYRSNKSMSALPAWPAARLANILDAKLVHGVGHMVELSCVLGLHKSLADAIKTFTTAASGEIAAVDAMRAEVALATAVKLSASLPASTLRSSLLELHSLLKNIGNEKICETLTIHKKKMSSAMVKDLGSEQLTIHSKLRFTFTATLNPIR
jgi:hypothetical protein